MTEQEKTIHYDTLEHIIKVRDILGNVIEELIQRMNKHDKSKLEEPELSVFTEYTPKLANSTYGSDEYNGFLNEMKVALDHHYRVHRHHPNHFPNGIDDMNLIDIIEMLCDWRSASMRHNDGDILKSIDINKERFNLSEQLVAILKNTSYFLFRDM